MSHLAVRPVARSTSTPPDERSSAPAPPKAQREQQERQRHTDEQQQQQLPSPHLHPPSAGYVSFTHHQQQQSQLPHRHGTTRQTSSGQGSDNSPNSDPSPGSHASTSIIPEHHRIYAATPYMSTGHVMPPTAGSAGHFSASSSPSYIHHHHQQQNPTYAYHSECNFFLGLSIILSW